MNAERQRMREADSGEAPWRFWGPYLSERQWGTVREDYSAEGDAWSYFTHEAARSRAYRWGEDGIAGYCDQAQRLCFSLAVWNGKDPILKERLFGLTGHEGNHGEDCKEAYYYLDATPSNSYLQMLYKYPQQEFPYQKLVSKNGSAGKSAPEYELVDTGVFDEDDYFDVFVEFAKAGPDDTVIQIRIVNRHCDAAKIDVLPQLLFRNTWSWDSDSPPAPSIKLGGDFYVEANHAEIGRMYLIAEERPEWLFTENETNEVASFGEDNPRNLMGKKGFYKDAFHEYVVGGRSKVVNPRQHGTKCAARFTLEIGGRSERVIRLRLTNSKSSAAFEDFDKVVELRRKEADEFYRNLQAGVTDEDERLVQRQAFAGLIWSKQFYNYHVHRWLDGDPEEPTPPAAREHGRNHDWDHLNNADVISMPDKWEYPWYAAWDLAFHCIPLALIDPEFAKGQLDLMTREWYMHPNGQIPAYEWNFGDVNPPVHAWATWRTYQIDRKQTGQADRAFLERVFHKLLVNFTWWVNRKDVDNRNVFQGGFLGLDNIGVFDRSKPIIGGGHLDQADGTSWMGMFALNMMRIALELALDNPVYEDIATKFFEHFLYIAKAMNNIGGSGLGLWDDEDKFYYDLLHTPDGDVIPLKVRSLVGLSPLFAVETLEPELLAKVPGFARRLEWVLANRPDLAKLVSRWHEPGRGERRLLSLLRGHRMKRLLHRMLDESEFFSDYGIRALSRYHREQPYMLNLNPHLPDDETLVVNYQPAESTSFMFGGNSNWRGPIWMPVNFLLIESMQKFHHYYGDDFLIECPTGSGQMMTILEASQEVEQRLSKIFLKDKNGHRPVYAHHPRMQTDPQFRDYVWFYEYFDGDSGRGVGANHQTGWTALIAKLLMPRAEG